MIANMQEMPQSNRDFDLRIAELEQSAIEKGARIEALEGELLDEKRVKEAQVLRASKLETERNMGIVDAAEKADEYEDLVRRFNALEDKCERLEKRILDMENDKAELPEDFSVKEVVARMRELATENERLEMERDEVKELLVISVEYRYKAVKKLALIGPVVEAVGVVCQNVNSLSSEAWIREQLEALFDKHDAYLAAQQAAGTKTEPVEMVAQKPIPNTVKNLPFQLHSVQAAGTEASDVDR